MQPHPASDDPSLLDRALSFGRGIIGAPERVETSVNQTGEAIQRGIEQIVYYSKIALFFFVLFVIARIAYSAYMWNLRRREVKAEEKQAAAEVRQAEALEAIRDRLLELTRGK